MTVGLFKGFHGLGKSGGLFDKAGFGKSGWGKSGWGRDDDCDRDADHGHGHGHGGGHGDGGSGSGGGQGFPAIAADTAGITFHVDLNGDGTMDDYLPVGAADTGASGTPTFADYYATASDDLAAEHPGADPAQVIVKATIYGPNGEESYYEFTGLEGDDDGDDDGGDCDRDDDRDHGRDHDRDDDHDRDWGHGKGHGWGKHLAGWNRDDRDDGGDDDRDDDRDDDCDGDRDGGQWHLGDAGWDDDACFFERIAVSVGEVSEDDETAEDDDQDDTDLC